MPGAALASVCGTLKSSPWPASSWAIEYVCVNCSASVAS